MQVWPAAGGGILEGSGNLGGETKQEEVGHWTSSCPLPSPPLPVHCKGNTSYSTLVAMGHHPLRPPSHTAGKLTHWVVQGSNRPSRDLLQKGNIELNYKAKGVILCRAWQDLTKKKKPLETLAPSLLTSHLELGTC